MNKLERIAEMEKQLIELKKQVEAEQVKKWPPTGDAVWWLASGAEYFTPYASNRQIEELKRLYAIWKTC